MPCRVETEVHSSILLFGPSVELIASAYINDLGHFFLIEAH